MSEPRGRSVTGRLAVKVRMARCVQRLPLSWLRGLEIPVVHRRAHAAAPPRPVILLALPRGGSTLAYQALVHGLDPFYLSNLWNMLYALPYTGGVLSRRRCAWHQSDFQSRHGFVEGACGPAEGLRFWSYWAGLGIDETVSAAVISSTYERRMRYLRDVLAVLTSPKRPFVTGYVGHALAVDRIRQWFPEAMFVRVHRDPLSNAMSILRARHETGERWFSVVPRECADESDATIQRQVASQVYWLNRRLESVSDDPAVIHVDYEDLCADPNGELQRAVDLCNTEGMALRVRQTLPERFPCRRVGADDDADTRAVADQLERLEQAHGALTRRSAVIAR